MLLPLVSGFVENAVRLVRGEPLVPEVNRKPGQLAEFGCEVADFRGLRGFGAVEPNRVADDDARDGKLPRRLPTSRAR